MLLLQRLQTLSRTRSSLRAVAYSRVPSHPLLQTNADCWLSPGGLAMTALISDYQQQQGTAKCCQLGEHGSKWQFNEGWIACRRLYCWRGHACLAG
mmetsp:Transcript_54707/g.102538  ORF Transcript_54707/g.102538 Transcript_54707/m.102538 type:complete len:96 (+) Transcript_54707:291-578(+)